MQNKCLLWAGITWKYVDNFTRSFAFYAFSLYWFMVIKAQKCDHFGGYIILKSNNDGQCVKFNIRSSNECPEAILKGLNWIIPGQQGEVTDSTHMKSTWHERERKKKKKKQAFLRLPHHISLQCLALTESKTKAFVAILQQLNTNKVWHCSDHWISQPAREEFCSKQTWSVMTGLRWECY